MEQIHYSLGLDIGIGSVGWAILQNGADGEPIRIQDLGVRIFDKAEQPKTGESLATPRRAARSARRRMRRHRHRLERIRYLLEAQGVISREALAVLFDQGGFAKSPYQLRAEALDRSLNAEEFARVLIHLAQRRGYRSNSTSESAKDKKDTGKVKQALEANQSRMAQGGYRTVGEMMYRDPAFWQSNPDGSRYHQTRNKADDYRFTVSRDDILNEARLIFEMQRKLGPSYASVELEESYMTILSGQRGFDEGPGPGSPFSGRIASKVGICTLEKDPQEPRAAKATYTFEYFKLLQDLNHMRLSGPNGTFSLTSEQREILKAAAVQSASLSFGQLRKKLCLSDDAFFVGLHYGNTSVEDAEKRKWPQMQSYHKMRAALDKASKGASKTLTTEQLDQIGTILTLYKSDDCRIAALQEACIPDIFYPALLPLSFSKFGSLSLKAMRKLMPHLELGARYDQACAEVYGDHRCLGTQVKKTKLSLADMKEITNPVVRRAISQAIKVVNAIVRTYGNPDVVRIELAREMGRSFDERRKLEKRQENNRAANEKARQQIVEYKGDYATGLDIVKFKLYREQDGVCLYSGKNLDISRLFEPGYVDVDHIIPYSRCFDDSYRNKVLVLSNENRQKGNRLPYEYFGHDADRWLAFETRTETLIHDYRKRQKLLKKKLTDEESHEFIQRNLTDTQYITRAIHCLLLDHLEFAESRYGKKPVQAVNGAVTAMLRGRWGITKIREDGDLHHCLDAAVVAVTSPGMVQKLTRYNQQRENAQSTAGYVDRATGEVLTRREYDAKYSPDFPVPWDRFRQELEARLDPVDPQRAILHLHLPTYETNEEIKPVFVSRMPNHKVTGAAHAETIRSGKKSGHTVTKTALTNLKLNKWGEIDGYYNPESDRLLYNALLEQLKAYDGNGAKAFVQPFYKPKRDGTSGPRVDKVKIMEKSTLNLPVHEGVAANGSMVRIDIFYVEDDGYYFVPIYVADTQKAELPDKAVVAHKPYAEWKKMQQQDFCFSLYPGDLIFVRSRRNITLNVAKGGSGDPKIFRKELLCYYQGADISSGTVELTTHDRRYNQAGLGIKTLLSIEKYQVDVLGNCYKVRLPEKRLLFRRDG